MAEIKIEKKAPILPWILGLLLLLLVGAGVYFGFMVDKKADTEVVALADEVPENEILPEETTTEVTALPAEVNTFVMFANEESNYTDAEMDIHHKYTGNALRHMGDALVALADKKGMSEEMNAQALHDELDTAADEIQENWKETDHADHIKNAFMKVSGALNQLADGSTSESLKKEAKDIDPNTLTLEQKADVKDFIDKTASVMKQLAME
ncbi:hypothetical protein WAF17_20285 [Bernardetia sp. ABR2-2B]|uniref:hypothetical protein n=1 Tax=Bernardetia sp. ABR2-2B TaxID=3127472 RepID=UPI0030CE5CA9